MTAKLSNNVGHEYNLPDGTEVYVDAFEYNWALSQDKPVVVHHATGNFNVRVIDLQPCVKTLDRKKLQKSIQMQAEKIDELNLRVDQDKQLLEFMEKHNLTTIGENDSSLVKFIGNLRITSKSTKEIYDMLRALIINQ